MLASIETTHRQIINLLAIIKDAAILLRERLPTMADEVNATKQMYLIGVSPFLVDHSRGLSGAQTEYTSFVSRKNVIGTIQAYIGRIDAVVKEANEGGRPIDSGQIKALWGKRQEFHLVPVVECERLGDCVCGGKFESFIDSSEKKCVKCGLTTIDFGVNFDDMQIYNADGQKPKQGRHHPSDHCKVWIMRIQAWATSSITEAQLAQLRACCARDRINMKRLSCAQLRDYLKELKIADYNHVPHIRKLLTGVAPPELTADELDELYMWFNRIAGVLKSLRPDRNITYYPYIIYKVLDQILPYGVRKAQILECIHLQSTKTMTEVDDVYRKVCAHIPKLKPKTTDKHEYELLL